MYKIFLIQLLDWYMTEPKAFGAYLVKVAMDSYLGFSIYGVCNLLFGRKKNFRLLGQYS